MSGKLFGVAGLLMTLLAGCTVVPGSNISIDSKETRRNDPVDYTDKINVYSITPQLVAASQVPASPAANPELEHARGAYEYVVGPGDTLRITVWDHPELSTPMAVARAAVGPAGPNAVAGQDQGGGGGQGNVIDADGTIYFPYIGSVKVAGLKIKEIRALLTHDLARFVVNPQLDVAVVEFRAQRVYVTGEVRLPGPQSLTDVPMTLLDAINQSGGLLPDADWDHVVLTRQGKESVFSLAQLYRHGDTRQNILLQPGDVIFVSLSTANKVFVLGEVKLAHSVPITSTGMTLAEALSEAGGLNELTSDASGVFVLRRSTDTASGKIIDVFQLNAKDATALVLADEFTLQPRDIVYVTAAPLTRWNKVISLLLPSLTGFYLNIEADHALKTTP